MSVAKHLACGLGVALLLGAVGCGPAGYHVTGTVSVDGQPVPKGKIGITPDRTKGIEGEAAYTLITDGKIEQPDSLVAGGPHVINIRAYDGVPYKLGTGTVGIGRELAPPQSLSVDLPKKNCSLTIDIRKAGGPGQYEVDVQIN